MKTLILALSMFAMGCSAKPPLCDVQFEGIDGDPGQCLYFQGRDRVAASGYLRTPEGVRVGLGLVVGNDFPLDAGVPVGTDLYDNFYMAVAEHDETTQATEGCGYEDLDGFVALNFLPPGSRYDNADRFEIRFDVTCNSGMFTHRRYAGKIAGEIFLHVVK